MSRAERKTKGRTERPLTISSAMVCVNCEHIYSAYGRNGNHVCPKCASEQVVLLAGWMTPRARIYKGEAA